MAGPGLRFPFCPPWPQTLAYGTEHVSPLLKGEVSVSTLPPPPHAAFPSPLRSLLLTDFLTAKSYHWALQITKFNEKFQLLSCWISLYRLRGWITVSLKLPPRSFLCSFYTCQYFLFHLHGILLPALHRAWRSPRLSSEPTVHLMFIVCEPLLWFQLSSKLSDSHTFVSSWDLAFGLYPNSSWLSAPWFPTGNSTLKSLE